METASAIAPQTMLAADAEGPAPDPAWSTASDCNPVTPVFGPVKPPAGVPTPEILSPLVAAATPYEAPPVTAEPSLPPAPTLRPMPNDPVTSDPQAAASAAMRRPAPKLQLLPETAQPQGADGRRLPPPRKAPPPQGGVPPRAAEQPRPARSARFPLLIASIVAAAGVGAAGGAAGFAAATKLMAPTVVAVSKSAEEHNKAPLQRADLADETKVLKDAVAQLRGNVRALAGDVATLRASVESSTKAHNSQATKLAESVERLEKAQAEPAARLAKFGEALERIERGAKGQTAAAAASDTTGSVAPGVHDDKAGLVKGWVLLRVFDGGAMVEGPDRVAEVQVGDNIRGVGRVQDIRRQDGRWVVVTSRGLIAPHR